MHNQPGPAAQQNEQQASTTTPHATDEQVAAGIAAAAALDPILATLQPSEVRAMYAAMVKAGAAPSATSAVPAGFTLVPEEPTQKMALCGAHYAECAIPANAVLGYRAMLAAAPDVPGWTAA